MSKFIGRKFNIGLGREVTRATGRASQYWLPTTELTLDDKVDVVKDDSTIGVIENMTDSKVVKKYTEGTIGGIINDDSFGLILYAGLGSGAVTGPTDSAYTHTFSVGQTAQHQSLTILASEPNGSGASSVMYPLTMIDSLDLNFEVGAYPTYSASFVANLATATTTTVSYTAPNNFKPQDATVRIADTYANLATGTAYAVRKASISISKNIEDDHNIGSVAVTDRLNKQFGVTGTLEIVYDTKEFIDTFMKADLQRAIQIKLLNADRTIGASTNPSITIKCNKVKFNEVARKIGKDDIVTQTVNFEAMYSIADSKMIDIVLVNSVASYV